MCITTHKIEILPDVVQFEDQGWIYCHKAESAPQHTADCQGLSSHFEQSFGIAAAASKPPSGHHVASAAAALVVKISYHPQFLVHMLLTCQTKGLYTDIQYKRNRKTRLTESIRFHVKLHCMHYSVNEYTYTKCKQNIYKCLKYVNIYYFILS